MTIIIYSKDDLSSITRYLSSHPEIRYHTEHCGHDLAVILDECPESQKKEGK